MSGTRLDQQSEVQVCSEDELWEGELVEVGLPSGRTCIVLNVEGVIRAYDNSCPHAGSRLSDGDFEGDVLTCASHMWEFNASTGQGINPCGSQLAAFPVVTRDGMIYVIDSQQEGGV